MKRIFYITLMMILLLTGCDPASCYFYKDTYLDKIESIELVKYTNANFEIVDASKVDLKFDYEKVEILETLDSSKIDEFLEDFEEIAFQVGNDSVNEPTGYCLLWHLKNGNFIVFSCTLIPGDRAYSMAAEFTSTSEFVRHLADFDGGIHYDDVLGKYFSSYSFQYEH